MKKNKRNAVVLALIGGYLFLVGAGLPALILFGLAIYQYHRFMQHPMREVAEMVEQDARHYDCFMPNDGALRSKLNRIYRRYRHSVKRYPSLAGTYTELIASLWDTLGASDSKSEWHQAMDDLLDEWPEPKSYRGGKKSDLMAQIRDAKKAAGEWADAESEVYRSAVH